MTTGSSIAVNGRWMSWIGTAALAVAIAGPLCAAELQVTIAGIENDDGKITVEIHAKRDGVDFPDEGGRLAMQSLPAAKGSLEFVFTGLAAGTYAVAAYHDENDNGELDFNFLGIPKEGYAFSRDARGFASPPSFEAAAIELGDDAPLSTTATLSY